MGLNEAVGINLFNAIQEAAKHEVFAVSKLLVLGSIERQKVSYYAAKIINRFFEGFDK